MSFSNVIICLIGIACPEAVMKTLICTQYVTQYRPLKSDGFFYLIVCTSDFLSILLSETTFHAAHFPNLQIFGMTDVPTVIACQDILFLFETRSYSQLAGWTHPMQFDTKNTGIKRLRRPNAIIITETQGSNVQREIGQILSAAILSTSHSQTFLTLVTIH